MVSVHKGDWDNSRGADANHEFNREWLAACQRVLKPHGSIWVSGTAHVIHSVGFAMQQLGFKLLNDISWVKPNPPPNLSCRYFTHATETIIWAAKDKKSRHTFNYKLMKETNHGKQMKSVWTIPPPEPWEKKFGKHPTQKPVALLERILLASTNEGDVVLDPFAGSGTALLAAFRLRRQAVACELTAEFLTLSLRRLCPNLVQLEISVTCLHFSVDPRRDPMDRSCRGRASARQASAPVCVAAADRRGRVLVVMAVPGRSVRSKTLSSRAKPRDLLFALSLLTFNCPLSTECRPNSNSSSKSAASTSSAAPNAKSSSPS
jgi:site-specific DNA-methyltransferase (adenine-specific)